ncbi:MAG: endonuclease/exonuclease/phosphatase family protein [Romboutsia sp.]
MKIVTYNIHKGMDLNNEDKVDEILKYLQIIEADVICIQEILSDIHERIIYKLNIKGYFLSNVNLKEGKYGVSIYCNEKIFATKGYHLTSKKEQRGFIHLELYLSNKLINIINLHLGLDLGERKNQMEEIMDYVSHLRGKIIICGDFNQINLSINNFCDLARIFDSEDIETFPKSKSRIDYIYISNNIKPTKYSVDFINLSDHYPVIGEFKI